MHSAKVLMYSFDFGEVSRLQQAARWDEATQLLAGVGMKIVGMSVAGGAFAVAFYHWFRAGERAEKK